ncbi:MAG: right-handed parallel beta-helix repeat-containing protein [Kastovskya adunca ATA6-11-RM4]|jgi:hypothetical protein|nr:right-handed parallel beta-helix repeat-containing protein [Kastovskya adunca ATA6-11-RM4]
MPVRQSIQCLYTTLLLLGTFSAIANAQPPNTTQIPDASSLRISPRIGAEFTTGAGVGYESSFGSIEGFFPLFQTPGSNLTFLEGRLLLSTENSRLSSNIILGHRFYSANANRIYGGYISYDTRETGSSSFDQLGLGLETLGDVWEFRGNAYIPVGDTRQLAAETVSSTLALSDPFFQGNFLAQTRTQQGQINRRFEAAMTGVDLEAGVKIASLGETGNLRGYAGLYYYDAAGSSDILGWRTRLEARPTDTLRLGLALSSDDTFGTNLVLSVGANFPGTRPRGIRREDSVLARLGESVTRQATIVVDEQIESESFNRQDTVFVTNPTTGQPWTFRHVNLGIGTGNGTFESPTGTVAEALTVAQASEIVYVQLGTNPGIPAFTIPDGVQVLSTGAVQKIDTVELGNIELPLSNTTARPAVTGTVTMGNDTTLSGFAIASTTGAGIAGSNISNIEIRDNAIANSTAEGISLTEVTGEVAIANNSITNSALEGFTLNNNSGQVELTLTNTQIAGNGGSANDGDGVNLELRNTASGNFTLSNNIIADNQGTVGIADGVEIQAFDSASGTFNFSSNQITSNQARGISVASEANAQGTFTIADNQITDNQLTGIEFTLSDDSKGTFNITRNVISNNQLSGVDVLISNSAEGTFDISDNTIADNLDNGINLVLSDESKGTVNISNNSEISRNGFNGININTNGSAELRVVIESNSIADNTFSGISVNTFDSARTFAKVQLNAITGSSFNDAEALTSDFGNICLQPLSNTIGSLYLDDSFGGVIQVEENTLPTNTITTSDTTFWSGTTVPPGTCGF